MYRTPNSIEMSIVETCSWKTSYHYSDPVEKDLIPTKNLLINDLNQCSRINTKENAINCGNYITTCLELVKTV
ncbi:hypothetical protein NECAME_00138 [Necator americanus]|uniref:Uncharacterized protein n=1 Tax=Necator americanus TaxID=51031 RepID=W2U035_NECAM|nr:hypothetical protein NECAME_00138 [Necator americanus]ETN87279.1 hypothetical protein NECAME_00138 [Necator americanus]